MERAQLNKYYSSDYGSLAGLAAQLPGEEVEASANAKAAGTFVVLVSDAANKEQTGTYTVSFTLTPVVDALEPNDAFGAPAAIGLNTTLKAHAFPGGEQDFYTVTTTAAASLKVAVTGVPPAMKPSVTIYSADYGSLAGKSAQQGGDSVTVEHHSRAKGRFVILVSDSSGKAQTLPYTLSVSEVPADDRSEPNDEFGSATPAAVNTAPSGFVFPEGDADVYAVAVPSRGRLTVSTARVPAELTMRFDAYSADYGSIGSRQATSAGIETSLVLELAEATTVRVRVSDAAGKASTSPYAVRLAFEPAADALEPDQEFADARPMGQRSVARTIFPSGDNDWSAITVTAASAVTVSVTSPPKDRKLRFDVYSADYGSQGGAVATDVGLDATRSFPNLAPGVYRVLVQDADGRSSLSAYTLTASGTGVSYAMPAEASLAAEAEPNAVWGAATAIAPNAAITGRINVQYDEDWYKVKLDRAGALTVSLTNAGADQRMNIETYGANKGYLQGKSATIDGQPASLVQEAGTAGFIYFRVKDANNKASAADHSISTAFAPAADANEPNPVWGAARLLTIGSEDAAYVFPRYDEDWYVVECPAAGLVTISATNVPTENKLNIETYNADKGYLQGATATAGGDGLTVKQEVGAAGRLYFKVKDSDSASSTKPYTVLAAFTPASDAQEPNPVWGASAKIEPDGSVKGYVFPRYDEDWYVVECPSAGALAITAGAPKELKLNIETYNADKGYVQGLTATSAGDDVRIVQDVASAQRVYFKVRDADSRSSTSTYSLTTSFTPVIDAGEDNPVFGLAYALPAAAHKGYLFPAYDEDWYVVRVDSQGDLMVRVEPPGDLRPNLELYRADKGYITGMTATKDGTNAILGYKATALGRYYFKVRDASSRRSVEPYSLTVTGATLIGTATPTPAPTAAPTATPAPTLPPIRTGGVRFERASYSADVKRAFNALPVAVVNEGSKAVAVSATVEGDAELPISFIGSGTPQAPLVVAPGSGVSLTVGVTASDAAKLAYEYALRLSGSDGSSSQATLSLALPPWDRYGLAIEPASWELDLSRSDAGRLCLEAERELVVTNTGSEPIADLRVAAGGAVPLFLAPGLERALLAPGASVRVRARAALDRSVGSGTATVTASGATASAAATVTYTAPGDGFWERAQRVTRPGRSAVSGTVQSFVCVNRPVYQVAIELPADVDHASASGAELVMSFSDVCRSLQPFDAQVLLNGREVARWERRALSGEYVVPVPASLLARTNALEVRTSNYAGAGHFCANAYNTLRLTFDGLTSYCADRLACVPTSLQELECEGGRDDDCDGAADCMDVDCCAWGPCSGRGLCPSPESCANGLDDDGNGLADCADARACCQEPSCLSSPMCQVSPCTGDRPALCPDGSCAASEAGCAGTTNPCPLALPVACPDGQCAEDIAGCNSVGACPADKPARCPDGSCKAALSGCFGCPPGKTAVCPDGSCASHPSECYGCTADRPALCPDRRCAPSAEACPGVTALPTATPEATERPTATPRPTATEAPAPSPTATALPTATAGPTLPPWGTPTATPEPSATAGPTALPSATPAQPGRDGDPCSRREECLSGNCRNGLCCASGRICCSSTFDCEMTDRCDLVSYVCEPKEVVDWLTDLRTLAIILLVVIVLAWATRSSGGK